MVKELFNRTVKRLHRNHSALLSTLAAEKSTKNALPIHKWCAEQLVDRLTYVKRDFRAVAELGCHHGHVWGALRGTQTAEGIQDYLACDMAPGMAEVARRNFNLLPKQKYLVKQDGKDESGTAVQEFTRVHHLCMDEEWIALQKGKFDLVLSSLSLHWVNDLEKALNGVHKSLKPDGCVAGCMFSGNTLKELTEVLAQAEEEVDGGISPHVSPMVGGFDVSALLLNTGYRLPTVDVEEYVLYFKDMQELYAFIKHMGERGALLHRRSYTPRKVFERAAELYEKKFRTERGLRATFEMVFFIGWAPHPDQPKPAQRGTGQVSLKSLEE